MVKTGRYNEDMNYNNGGILQCELGAGPAWFSEYLLQSGYEKFSAIEQNCFAAAILPVFKYASIGCIVDENVRRYDRTIEDVLEFDSLMTGSRTKLAGSLEIRATLPLLRNINRGKRTYWDNCYATIFTSSSLVAADRFLKNFDTEILFDPGYYSPRARAAQSVGLRIRTGVVRDYLFNGALTLSGSYDLFRNKLFLSLACIL